MQIGALLKSFIYLVSSALLYPTLCLLSALVPWVLVLSGSVAAEWLGRQRMRRLTPREFVRSITNGDDEDVCSYHVRAYWRQLSGLLSSYDGADEQLIETLLQEHSADLWKSLDHVRMIVRIGPGLGLIGTLIPMGTGLAALGQGDITKLSSDLVIAFTTTVVGLSVGLLSYFFYWKKKRWIEQDIRQMEFLTEIIVQRNTRKENRHEVHEAAPIRIPR